MPEGDKPPERETAIPRSGRKIPLVYHGETGAVARIATVNGLLTLVTLGVYRFWAKTHLRRYIWGHVSVDGDRLEYTGLAKELLIGFLVAMAVLVPLVVIHNVLGLTLDPTSWILVIEELIYLFIFWVLINVALFRARRYRLSRTKWRGIRFRQTGTTKDYTLKAMGWQFLNGLTLGLIYPVYRMRVQAYLMDNTWFGSEKFTFHGRGGELFGTWIIAWLLFYPSLGISYLWYRVREYNYVVSKVTARGFRAEATLRTGSVIKVFLIFLVPTLIVGWIGMSILSETFFQFFSVAGDAEDPQVSVDFQSFAFVVSVLGILVMLFLFRVLITTFLLHPLLRLVCENTTLIGGNDLDKILQAVASDITYGEGLADALDVGEF